jgi:predicted 2-oxoglutarate/Fe(II)-dependent dioxygenase YbiX
MNSNLKDFIFKKNCIDTNECQQILESIKKQEWQKHEWYNYHRDRFHSYYEKELNVLFNDDFSKEILSKHIISTLHEYCTFVGEKTFVHKFSDVRFNHYPVGTMMRKHFDHIYSIFDGNLKGIPILSIVGLLNDDYEGGEFVFSDDYSFKLESGDIMIFPSNFLYQHEVKEVTKGDRYSFVSWAF